MDMDQRLEEEQHAKAVDGAGDAGNRDRPSIELEQVEIGKRNCTANQQGCHHQPGDDQRGWIQTRLNSTASNGWGKAKGNCRD